MGEENQAISEENPNTNESEKLVKIRHTFSNYFRNIRADGAISNITTNGELVNLNFYCEKLKLPEFAEMNLETGDETLMSEYIIDREIEVSVFMQRNECIKLISRVIDLMEIDEEE